MASFKSSGRAFYAEGKPSATSAARASRRAKRLARDLDLDLDVRFSGGWFEIVADAPLGKVFNANDCHGIVAANAGPQSDGLWERVLADLELGMNICANDECEYCGEMRREAEEAAAAKKGGR